jgi:YjbE family integral membrane protein
MPDFLHITDPGLLTLISQGSALIQVILIDLFMAGDNAVAVGLAAAGLAADDRKKAIMYGLIAAIVTRILFVLLTVQLLQIPGLLLVGGILLCWVAWNMYQDLRHPHEEAEVAAKAEAEAETAMIAGTERPGTDLPAANGKKPKTLRSAIIQILIADVSMSLDNVLAVAGAAHRHVSILVFGLILAIAMMGFAAHAIANLLHKYRWIGYLGLAIILFVAARMIWDGVVDVQEHHKVIVEWFNGLSGKSPAPAH